LDNRILCKYFGLNEATIKKYKVVRMKIYIQRNLLKKIHLKIYKILMNLVKITIMKEKRMILKWKYDTINTLKEVKLWEITN